MEKYDRHCNKIWVRSHCLKYFIYPFSIRMWCQAKYHTWTGRVGGKTALDSTNLSLYLNIHLYLNIQVELALVRLHWPQQLWVPFLKKIAVSACSSVWMWKCTCVCVCERSCARKYTLNSNRMCEQCAKESNIHRNRGHKRWRGTRDR